MEHPAISSSTQPQYRLLYVGTDLNLMKFLQDELKHGGWFAVRCPDGKTARVLLNSQIHYDLLLFDDELPDTSGREIVRLARSLEHRQRTPIILLSLKDCAREARGVGVNEFLQKPEQHHALVKTVRRLLVTSGGQ
jgi:DNA-binding response OmpR family regulator